MTIRNIKKLTLITFLFSIIMFVISFLDLAALHDIGNDYVSQEILTYLKITTSENLPDWTKTAGEWFIVTVSFFLRVIFLILNTLVLYYYYKRIIPGIAITTGFNLFGEK